MYDKDLDKDFLEIQSHKVGVPLKIPMGILPFEYWKYPWVFYLLSTENTHRHGAQEHMQNYNEFFMN